MLRVLVVNAGSATLKLEVVGADDSVEATARLDPWDGGDVTDALDGLLATVGAVDAVGHRVVHGGAAFDAPVMVDALVRERIASLSSLAPTHQPRALLALVAAEHALPAVPHLACFDTAFHRSIPRAARVYALPEVWRARWMLERCGFHGLSHAWVATRAPEVARGPAPGSRIVSCHLGAGASVCAIDGGRSVDTTMGLTPLEGLVMATRSGTVDPGLVLWLITEANLAPAEVADGLERLGGLAGLSRTDGDMREVLRRRAAGDADAALAFDVHAHRLRREIAAMAAALGGLDVLAFTGGVGEHSPEVRAAATEGLAFLGVAIDADSNAVADGDADVSAHGAPVRTVVVTSREDLEIARQVRTALGQRGSTG